MAIALVNSSTSLVAQTSTLTLNKPTGTLDGHVLYAFVIQDDTLGPFADATGPAGWVKLGTNSTTHMHTTAWRKVASSEGASWNWTHASAILYQGMVIALSGADTVVPEDITTLFNSANTGTSLTATGGTTVTDNAWFMPMYVAWNAATLTKDASATQVVATFGSTGDLMRADQITKTPAGATGNLVATQDAGGNEWVAVSVFVRPAGAQQQRVGAGFRGWPQPYAD